MVLSDEIILISISGRDRPGLTAAITEVLAKYDATILDIGQAAIHNHLSLDILFHSPNESESGKILRGLLLKAAELDIKINFPQ